MTKTGMTIRMKLLSGIILLLFATFSFSQEQNSGSITGTVLDHELQAPVKDVLVDIIGSGDTALTDADGKFEFKNIPFGTYRLEVNHVGYNPVVKTDIVVLASRPTDVTIELISKSYRTDTVNVEAKYFQKATDETTSSFNLDFEEVRRSPGAVEDVSRMVQVLPGVSPGNDQRNDLIVRGGSPAENMTMIDGMEIPNINHYPTQGSSSGPISMINVKLISDVNFSTGGFSARYGDYLSSVLDIRFREGYRKRILSDINLSSAGFGGVFEGPLFSDRGSFILSARRSYLNLIRGAIRLAAVPNYWDFNFKGVYNISKNNILEFIGLAGIDEISFEGDNATISDDNPYGKASGTQQEYSMGFNLKTLFKKGYWQNVVSNSFNHYKYNVIDIKKGTTNFDNNSYENTFGYKSELLYSLNKASNIIFGIEAKYIMFKNYMYIPADTSGFGDPLPEYLTDTKNNYQKAGAYTQYTLKLFRDKLNLNAGLRFDYFSGIKDKFAFSPRFGASFKLTSTTTLNAATGIYSQAPEDLWVASDTNNVNLKYIQAYHYVAGIEQLLSEDTRFTIEVYYKKYLNYPVSVYIPTYILVGGGADNGPNFVGAATSKGYGYARGIDFSIQKKLSGTGLYGILSYSFCDSRFTALAGGPKPGSFDYKHNFTVIAGYQISNDWLVGIKYRYTTGRPYTPFDIQASTYYGRVVYLVNQFNDARYKDYSRLDLRVDKKWNFKKWSIVSYVELQNVFNTQNVYQYFWNNYKNEIGTIYQWGFLPVGGFSVQF